MPTMEWVKITLYQRTMYFARVQDKTYLVQRTQEDWAASVDAQPLAGPYMQSWDAMEACAAAAGYGRVDHHWTESKL